MPVRLDSGYNAVARLQEALGIPGAIKSIVVKADVARVTEVEVTFYPEVDQVGRVVGELKVKGYVLLEQPAGKAADVLDVSGRQGLG
jgi:hypothetical protein